MLDHRRGLQHPPPPDSKYAPRVDPTEWAAERRRKVAEAARRRTSVGVDDMTHYTTVIEAGGGYADDLLARRRPAASGGRLVDDHDYAWQHDHPLSPDRDAGHRVRATAGTTSYAEMYERQTLYEHPSARSSYEYRRSYEHPAHDSSPPKRSPDRAPPPLRGRRSVRWGDGDGEDDGAGAPGSRAAADADLLPPAQVYARDALTPSRRDLDDGYGGDWTRRPAPAPPPSTRDENDAAGWGLRGARDDRTATRIGRELDRLERGWNDDVTVEEDLKAEDEEAAAEEYARGTRPPRTPPGERPLPSAKPEWNFGKPPGVREAPSHERGASEGHGARPIGSTLAALKGRRAAQRPISRIDTTRPKRPTSDERAAASTTRQPRVEPAPPFDENAPIGVAARLGSDPAAASLGATSRAARTTDLGGTWDEYDRTLRPGAVRRFGAAPATETRDGNPWRGAAATSKATSKASAKAPARPPVGASLADDPNPFGGYTPPKPQRERNLSSGAAFVTGGVGHLSLDLPPDMAGMVVPEGADAGPTSLTPCETCGRKFNAKALVIHARSCARVFATKRSQFDAKGMRATGTDLERFNREKGGGGIGGRDDESRARPTASRAPRAKPQAAARRPTARRDATSTEGPGGTVPKWKRQSEAFRAGLRAGTGGAPAPAPDDEDLTPCPHCGRSFNETAAERHIPRCQDIKGKPTRLVRGGGRGAHVSAGGGNRDEAYRRTRAF